MTAPPRNAVIVHGTCDRAEYFGPQYPSLSNSHWLPWIQKELLSAGVHAQTPEMPQAYEPVYPLWKRELDRFDVDDGTLLIGHSCGAGFLLRWLGETRVGAAKLILVAPWIDPERERTRGFFDFAIDPALGQRVRAVHLMVSSDDHPSVLRSADAIAAALPGLVRHRFETLGHFTAADLGGDAFPQLREIALG